MPLLESTSEPGEPEPSEPTLPVNQVREVLERHERGESDTAIAGALWHPTTYYIKRVRAIVAEHDNNNTDLESSPCGAALGEDDSEDVVVVVGEETQ